MFISRDSNEGNIKNPLSLNLYIYCNNNPVNRIDLTGFDSYIIYDSGSTSGDENHIFKDQAEIEAEKYTEEYRTDCHIIGVSSAQEFKEKLLHGMVDRYMIITIK